MKSIMVTYPDFQALPKGIKRLLVMSESLFFGESKAPSDGRSGPARMGVAVVSGRSPGLGGRGLPGAWRN
jgi:hypothetical protein